MEIGDRRIRRTKRAIDEAFVALMDEKGFDKVTVNEAARRADISRATFYVHYVDKYAWLDDYIDRLLGQLHDTIGRSDGRGVSGGDEEYLRGVLDHLDDNFKTYALLLRNGGPDLIQRHLRPLALECVGQSAAAEVADLDEVQREFIAQVVSSAMTGTISWWIERNRPVSKEELARTMIKLRVLAREIHD